MNLDVSIHDLFGSHLADGAEAVQFRVGRIDPYVDTYPEIILDFTGVRNANSSFVNALVGGLVEQYGAKVLEKLVFKGCNPPIQVLIKAAVDLGIRKTGGRVNA